MSLGAPLAQAGERFKATLGARPADAPSGYMPAAALATSLANTPADLAAQQLMLQQQQAAAQAADNQPGSWVTACCRPKPEAVAAGQRQPHVLGLGPGGTTIGPGMPLPPPGQPLPAPPDMINGQPAPPPLKPFAQVGMHGAWQQYVIARGSTDKFMSVCLRVVQSTLHREL